MKHMPLNPYLGTVHDGSSTEFQKGFVRKRIHWLARFRYNLLPVGMALGRFGRNPGGKFAHWLEISTIEKFKVSVLSEECLPHTIMSIVLVLFTTWHMGRYAYAHPDVSYFNAAIGRNKDKVMFSRFSTKQEFDKPTFRWFQSFPEFWGYNVYRDFIANGWIANDPYVEMIKAQGRFGALIAMPEERGSGLYPEIWPYLIHRHKKFVEPEKKDSPIDQNLKKYEGMWKAGQDGFKDKSHDHGHGHH